MLYMISLSVRKAPYAQWMKVRGKRDQQSSLHFLLDSTFGPSALKPFRAYPTSGDAFQVVGYTNTDKDGLKAVSQMIACPDTLDVIDMQSLRTKTMPEFTKGQLIGFDLKTVPVRRVSRKKSEIDVFDSDLKNGIYQAKSEENRIDSYMNWLDDRFGNVADLDREMTALEISDNVPRQRREICRQTEIKVTGNLTVKDPDGFTERLAKGVGRHKSYGYGMLVLRAPQLNHRIHKAA